LYLTEHTAHKSLEEIIGLVERALSQIF